MRKNQHYFCDVPVKATYTESNHKETSEKLKLRDILKDKLPIIFKSVKVTKVKEKLSNCFRLKTRKCDF